MTSRMLINATHSEEIRVALVSGSKLENLDIEVLGREQQKANIYKGKITRIEPSLEAVFVDYGEERHGFLPFREVSKIYHKTIEQSSDSEEKPSIRDLISEGQELIVQVEKEIRGNKGAALTTFVSLAGCYLVLMPLNPNTGGISRRIEGEERAEIREALSQLKIPEGMGVIVRTAGVGREIQDLQWDLDVLLQQWASIEKATEARPAPFLIYQESSIIVRAIRDHLKSDIIEILIDSPSMYEEAYKHIRMMRPDFIEKVKLYNDSIPLFNRFQIESQIEMAFKRNVTLPSGGSIVIDHTEALISIDINSARATKGGDIEETAYSTNLEAADEIARQLRLRDIGGLIVIDFIDMNVNRNQREVEQRLKNALAMDRARVQIGKISRFGLLEMSRQRLRPALSAARDIVCPRCMGQGTIRSIEALALNMVRLVEEESIKDGTLQINLELPVEVSTYLINEKRQAILDIERKHHVRVIIIPSQHLATPNYSLTKIRKDDVSDANSLDTASYSLASKPEQPKSQYNTTQSAARQSNVAAVNNINMQMAPQKGIFKRILSSFLGSSEEKEQTTQAEQSTNADKPHQHRNRRHQQHKHQNNRRRNNNNHNRKPNNNNRKPTASTGATATNTTAANTTTDESKSNNDSANTNVAPNKRPKNNNRRGYNQYRRNRARQNEANKNEAETSN